MLCGEGEKEGCVLCGEGEKGRRRGVCCVVRERRGGGGGGMRHTPSGEPSQTPSVQGSVPAQLVSLSTGHPSGSVCGSHSPADDV